MPEDSGRKLWQDEAREREGGEWGCRVVVGETSKERRGGSEGGGNSVRCDGGDGYFDMVSESEKGNLERRGRW